MFIQSHADAMKNKIQFNLEKINQSGYVNNSNDKQPHIVQANRKRKLARRHRHLVSRASIVWRRPTESDADLARAVTSETGGLAGQEFLAPIDLVSPVLLYIFQLFSFQFIN